MAAAAAARRPEVPSWRRRLAVSPTTPTSGAAQMKRGKRPSALTRPICPSRRISALKAHALLHWLHQCSPAQPSDTPLSLSLVASLGRPAAADLAGRRHRRRRREMGRSLSVASQLLFLGIFAIKKRAKAKEATLAVTATPMIIDRPLLFILCTSLAARRRSWVYRVFPGNKTAV
uniref:Uncharacterized protein n=1 Tax=Oryza meridionalis TaxID=40149 RepID=A0A0E0DE61_9ORYZ